jgi:hypothetical protein
MFFQVGAGALGRYVYVIVESSIFLASLLAKKICGVAPLVGPCAISIDTSVCL